MDEKFTCGLGDIPPELEGLARESENCFGCHEDPKDPEKIKVHEINGKVRLDNLVDERLSKHLSKYHPLCCHVKVNNYNAAVGF